MSRSRLPLLLLVGPLMTACATSPGDDLAPFGDSVRHTLQAQTYRPGDTPPPTLRGDKAAEAMQAYRKAGGEPSRQGGSMTLDMGP